MYTTTLTLLSLASTALASNVIYSLDNVKATVYYDLTESATNDICAVSNGGPFSAGWADATINLGITQCQSLMPDQSKSLADLGTNRIVAIDHNLITADPAYWCGRELVLYDASGAAIEFSEGSFIVWDGCAAAMTEHIVDLSALAFVQVKGGTCGGSNPTGLRYEVLDNYIWTPNGASIASSPSSVSKSSSSSAPVVAASSSSSASSKPKTTAAVNVTANTAAQPVVNAAVVPLNSTGSSTSTAAVTASSAVPASASAGPTSNCTYGAWQCNGLQIEICTYADNKTLAWETVGQCGSLCEVSASGSVDCQ